VPMSMMFGRMVANAAFISLLDSLGSVLMTTCGLGLICFRSAKKAEAYFLVISRVRSLL